MGTNLRKTKMKIKYNNNTYSVQSKVENSELISSINNESLVTKFEQLEEKTFFVSIDGQKHKIFSSADHKSVFVWIDGYSFKFDLVDEEHRNTPSSIENLNRQEVTAPMPGNIVKVMVEVGQQVTEASPLLIVEAMKMETTLYSQISGKVTEINCTEKEQVDSDKILLVVEKIS